MCDTVIDILKDNTNYLDKLQNEINDLTERVVKLDSGLKYDPDITNDYDDEDDVRYGLETLLKHVKPRLLILLLNAAKFPELSNSSIYSANESF